MTSALDLTNELAGVFDFSRLITNPEDIGRRLRDNSWLSPMLTDFIGAMSKSSGASLDVAAIALPETVDELRACLSAAYRHDVPVTMLGAGTSNFGQAVPLHGGIVIDVRGLHAIGRVEDDRVTVQTGAIVAKVEEIARAAGREFPLLTTTYASATCGGWVAGGHVGLGSTMYGTIWDGNVLGATILTLEAVPQEIVLDAESVTPVLHAYGTTGVISDVTLRLVEQHDWVEAVAVFDTFDAAARFTASLATRSDIRNRVAAAQEGVIAQAFTPLRRLIEDGDSIVLMIIDAEDIERCREAVRVFGGRYQPWKGAGAAGRPTLAYMVYGHRMLWVKKIAPDGAFLHCYFDPDRVLEQLSAVKERFGESVLVELKYIRSRWLRSLRGIAGDGVLPAPVLTLVPGNPEQLAQVMAACDEIGITYQNPHTFSLEETGLFPHPEELLAFKHVADPKGLLNPGKLASFVPGQRDS